VPPPRSTNDANAFTAKAILLPHLQGLLGCGRI
jgi:hypothetical protein